MILFFQSSTKTVLAVEAAHAFSPEDTQKLVWLFSEATPVQSETLEGWYVGPRREMITPWSTNAVEITQNMGLTGISRIEEYFPVSSGDADHDPMLQRIYNGLNQEIFTISKKPDPIVYIEDLEVYNQQEGLALSQEEIAYLNEVSQKLGRKLTDSEVFGFSQVNSEHCRHKIFGGVFITGGEIKAATEAIIGAECVLTLKNYNFTKCFMGTNGISLTAGFTTPDVNEARVKSAAMESSRRSYILADHSKFDEISSATFAQLGKANIITDRLSNRKYAEYTSIKEVM